MKSTLPFLSDPSANFTNETTPWKWSNQESNTNALTGRDRSPAGGGTSWINRSKTFSTPSPVLALILKTSAGFEWVSLASSAATRSGSAAGRSILLSTGKISSPCLRAAAKTARVWAWTPWEASTSRMAASAAARDRKTSVVKSTWPGVSMRFKRYRFWGSCEGAWKRLWRRREREGGGSLKEASICFLKVWEPEDRLAENVRPDRDRLDGDATLAFDEKFV